MNDEGKLLMMIRYAGSDAGRDAYDSMLVELARLRAIEASVDRMRAEATDVESLAFTLSCDHCGGAAITSPNGLFNERSSGCCASCGYPGGVVIEESGEDEDVETVYTATWVSGIEPGDVCDACVCSECDAIREWPRR